MNNKIIAIIPAEGESKINGVKKNLVLLNGFPLIKHTISYAKSIQEISRVVIATSDEEIAKIAKECGAEVPFLLPNEWCRKGVEIKGVLKKTLELLKERENYSPDFVVFLEATHPLREKIWMEKLIELIKNEDFDQVFFAKSEKDNFWKIDNGGLILLDRETSMKEKKQPLYRELSGLGAVTKSDVLMGEDRLGQKIGIVPVSGLYTIVDIKNENDLYIAKQVYKNYVKT